MLVLDLPQDAVTLRLLFNLESVAKLFQQMSYLQTLHLTNNLIAPGPLSQQEDFLLKAQEIFTLWPIDTLKNYHSEIGNTSLQFERKKLLELEPTIPWELLQMFVEIFKLPIEELLDFAQWFTRLSRERLLVLVQILSIEPFWVLELKRRFTPLTPTTAHTPAPPASAPLAMDPLSPPGQGLNSILTDELFAELVASTSGPTFDMLDDQLVALPIVSPPPPQSSVTAVAIIPGEPTLRIARQPPPKTVYQRILKPPPSVMLVGPGAQGGALSNYFVEASLVRSDSDAELPACIDGTRVERVSNGVFATFKKLKLLSTSQQQGTLFRLKFVLKKYVGNVFQVLPKSCVYSEPIEVFSHTQYLNERQDAPDAVKITEVLPPSGTPGTRLVILGGNFVNGPTLRARFGQTEVVPTFHEKGTLICTVPPRTPGTLPGNTLVSVSNDGVRYSDSKVFFMYVS
jgi:hypothetical protein